MYGWIRPQIVVPVHGEARHMAEQARERIAALDTRESGHAFTVTASFGVASTLTAGFEFKSLVAQADQALYQSKRAGRNQVSLYRAPARPGLEEEPSPPSAPQAAIDVEH